MLSAALEFAATGACPEVVSGNGMADVNALRSNQSALVGEKLIPIDTPETRRENFILHNKINQPVIQEQD